MMEPVEWLDLIHRLFRIDTVFVILLLHTIKTIYMIKVIFLFSRMVWLLVLSLSVSGVFYAFGLVPVLPELLHCC